MERYKGYTHFTTEDFHKVEIGTYEHPLFENQYVIDEQENILRYRDKKFHSLHYQMDKIRPKNPQQKMAFDLLDNNGIPVKFLTGIAGGGKTRLAFEFGLKKLREDKVKRILIIRNPAEVGEKLGFLQGGKDAKLEPWKKTINDLREDNEFTGLKPIEFDIPAYQQGITWLDTWVIVEEAQMLCKDLIQMLGSRVGEGSFITFTGDIKQAFDRKYKDDKNGMNAAIEVLKGNKIVGVVEMQKSERGPVAEMFATMW